jgi:hypothetical protein
MLGPVGPVATMETQFRPLVTEYAAAAPYLCIQQPAELLYPGNCTLCSHALRLCFGDKIGPLSVQDTKLLSDVTSHLCCLMSAGLCTL